VNLLFVMFLFFFFFLTFVCFIIFGVVFFYGFEGEERSLGIFMTLKLIVSRIFVRIKHPVKNTK
jgi:hypothetical protein